jgi:hypothetical protein
MAVGSRAIPTHHQPIAFVLDFVNPERSGRRSRDLRRLAGRLAIMDGASSCCCYSILFVGSTHDDPERGHRCKASPHPNAPHPDIALHHQLSLGWIGPTTR